MGADMKGLKTRLRSVESTMHLTRAMGLVASSKMRRSGESMQKSRAYADAFGDVMNLLSRCPACEKSPYMQTKETGTPVLIVIAGDRGLAGGYNANVFRLTDGWLAGHPGARVIALGRRACDRYGAPEGGRNSSEKYTAAQALTLARTLCAAFLQGTVQSVTVVSTRYVSMMTQEAFTAPLLPLQKEAGAADRRPDPEFEPGEREVLDAAVPDYVAGRIVCALRESFACEVAARRMAMDAADKNARAMMEDLQLQYNRARQNMITQEITEIVAGSGS